MVSPIPNIFCRWSGISKTYLPDGQAYPKDIGQMVRHIQNIFARWSGIPKRYWADGQAYPKHICQMVRHIQNILGRWSGIYVLDMPDHLPNIFWICLTPC